MLEVRWHGRGGQGAKSAAQFLAEAALLSGKHIQAFPEYGPERAGAPIRAFTRIDDSAIRIHSSVTNPDIVVVIDPTLISEDILDGLKDDGILVANTSQSPEQLRKSLDFKQGKVVTIDATKVALDTIGVPMPNTPMLGALLKVKEIVSMESLKEQIRDKFLKKIGEDKTNANIEAIKKAYEEAQIG